MKNRLTLRTLGCAILLAASGCAAQQAKQAEEQVAENDLTVCTDPRPELCTMQYDPVCARIGEGDAAEWKTYSSGCSACSDPQVTAYRPGGECKE